MEELAQAIDRKIERMPGTPKPGKAIPAPALIEPTATERPAEPLQPGQPPQPAKPAETAEAATSETPETPKTPETPGKPASPGEKPVPATVPVPKPVPAPEPVPTATPVPALAPAPKPAPPGEVAPGEPPLPPPSPLPEPAAKKDTLIGPNAYVISGQLVFSIKDRSVLRKVRDDSGKKKKGFVSIQNWSLNLEVIVRDMSNLDASGQGKVLFKKNYDSRLREADPEKAEYNFKALFNKVTDRFLKEISRRKRYEKRTLLLDD